MISNSRIILIFWDWTENLLRNAVSHDKQENKGNTYIYVDADRLN